MGYRYEAYGSIRVAWTDDLDGGGRGFGQQIVPAARHLFGPVDRACEFCAGPGFIGFSLLAHGLCGSLCLTEVNPAAVAAIEHTIALNGLEDRVSVVRSDGLDAIPRQERWDLVVSNPPHFEGAQTGEWGLRAFDPDWNIHRRFYGRVRQHLQPHGQCLFVENYHGSSEETFLPLLEGSGLEYAGSFMLNQPSMSYAMGQRQLPPVNTFYFFWTRARHDDIVWRDAVPRRRVELVLDPSGAVLHDEDCGSNGPLRLPIGEKYALLVSSRKAGWRLDWDFMRNELRSRPASPASDDDVLARDSRRVIDCIPTAPNRIMDETGRVLVEFE